jgi:hypothetical protein
MTASSKVIFLECAALNLMYCEAHSLQRDTTTCLLYFETRHSMALWPHLVSSASTIEQHSSGIFGGNLNVILLGMDIGNTL